MDNSDDAFDLDLRIAFGSEVSSLGTSAALCTPGCRQTGGCITYANSCTQSYATQCR